MNDMNVWLPLASAGVGFAMGALIGFGLDKMRRKALAERAKLSQRCLTSLVDSCREVLSDAWFAKVRRNYQAKVESGRIAA